MKPETFTKIWKAGIRLTGYGAIAICIGVAVLAYVRLVLAVNNQERAEDIYGAIAYGITTKP